MRVLIDIGHPGHVHLFKNLANQLIQKGHQVLFTCREKEFEIALIQHYQFQYVSFGKKYNGLIGKIWGLLKFDALMWKTALSFKPHLFLSHGSPYAAHAAFLLGKIHISLEDTGNNEQVNLYLPFTKFVLTSNDFHRDYKSKQIRYNSCHELAYLHPDVFQPNPHVLKKLLLSENEPYTIVRFISWNATHDIGQKGFSKEEKLKLIQYLSSKGKVFISSEGPLPQSLDAYRLDIHPAEIHDVLYYAQLFVGEGATMASECAMMGTPAVYINTMNAGTIDAQEKAGLLLHLKDADSVFKSLEKLFEVPHFKEKFRKNSMKYVASKVNLTKFILTFIEDIMQHNV